MADTAVRGTAVAHPLLLRRLLVARQEQRAVELADDERPRSLDEAYATAAALLDALGLEPNGAKVGANGATGQRLLGLTEPLWGHTLAGLCWKVSAELDAGDAALGAEAEWIFTLGRDLDGAAAQDPAAVEAAIAQIALGIEITRPSYIDPMREGGLAIIADNGVHAGLVIGDALSPQHLAELRDRRMWLAVDDEARRHGSASQAGVDPLAALLWLAADRARRGVPLRRGHRIATGALLTCRDLPRGHTVRAGIEGGAECTLVRL